LESPDREEQRLIHPASNPRSILVFERGWLRSGGTRSLPRPGQAGEDLKNTKNTFVRFKFFFVFFVVWCASWNGNPDALF
jgi:hypothetical protein